MTISWGLHVSVPLFLHMPRLYQPSAALLFPPPVFLLRRKFYPDKWESNPFSPLNPLLKFPKFQECACLDLTEGCHVETVQERLYPVVYLIHNVGPKEVVPGESLIILQIEAVSM